MDNEGFYDSLEDDEFSSASSTSVGCVDLQPHHNQLQVFSKIPVRRSSSNVNIITIKEPSPNFRYEEYHEDVTDFNLHKQLTKVEPSTSFGHSTVAIKRALTVNSKLNLLAKGDTFDEQFSAECNVEELRENCDISTIVPLYNGDIYKSEIKSTAGSLSNPSVSNQKGDAARLRKVNSKTNSDCKSRRSYRSYKSKVETVIQDAQSRSYLSMFQARNGYPEGRKQNEVEDTVRSIFGDSRRSSLSSASTGKGDFKDAKDYDSDSTSFYLEHIQKFNDKSTSEYDFPTSSLSIIGSTVCSKYNSTSKLSSTCNEGRNVENQKRRSRKSTFIPIPALGKLGPDTVACQEKLQRRKKQIRYGQVASNRNRIRMAEINVLKDLKAEIQKSNSLEK